MHNLLKNPKNIWSWDESRNLAVPGSFEETLEFCVEHFIAVAKQSINDHGHFFVALSGGSTPKAILKKLCSTPYKSQLQWDKVHLFWSDERSVAPDHADSNYHMAMQAGLSEMPIPKNQIHRMHAEDNIQENANRYERTIQNELKDTPFDLIMLGMGEDGHTASLFPDTEALHSKDVLVAANYIPSKNTWRMTMTYDCINRAKHIVIYVLGASKGHMLYKVFSSNDPKHTFPVQLIGNKSHKALWIIDIEAAHLLLNALTHKKKIEL